MEFKLITFWAALTFALYLITRISYILSGTSYNWKYYKQETWIGIIYLLVFILGGIVLSCYAIIEVAQWWFKI